MYTIAVNYRIGQIISAFHFIGLWHDDRRSKFHKWFLSILHLMFYAYYPFALITGALTSDNHTESIFTLVMSILTFVTAVRLYYFVLKQNEILHFIRKIGVHSIKDSEKLFCQINDKINAFNRFINVFVIMILSAFFTAVTKNMPIFSTEKRLPFRIYFPLDWTKNDIYYWITYTFTSLEVFMTIFCAFFSVIIWYMMLAFALEYEILGDEFKNLGRTDMVTVETQPKEDLFLNDLILLIKKHRDLQEYKNCFSTPQMKF